MLPFIRDEKHRKGRSGCVQTLDTKRCQAQKAYNTDSRTNYAVKYATARGHLSHRTTIIFLVSLFAGPRFHVTQGDNKNFGGSVGGGGAGSVVL